MGCNDKAVRANADAYFRFIVPHQCSGAEKDLREEKP